MICPVCQNTVIETIAEFKSLSDAGCFDGDYPKYCIGGCLPVEEESE